MKGRTGSESNLRPCEYEPELLASCTHLQLLGNPLAAIVFHLVICVQNRLAANVDSIFGITTLESTKQDMAY